VKAKTNIPTTTKAMKAIDSKTQKEELSPCATCHIDCSNFPTWRYPCDRWKAWYRRQVDLAMARLETEIKFEA